MALIDFTLNLAALLLWFHWRSLRFEALVWSSPRTLTATLKRTEHRRIRGWQILLGLAVLLLVRGWIYYQLGGAARWNPKLNLGLIILVFRSDHFVLALLFSILSFVRALMIVYFWMAALVAVNRANGDSDPVHRYFRLHLGFLSRWPAVVLVLGPVLLAAACWMLLQPLLAWQGVITPAHSVLEVTAQGFLVGAALVFSLKYVLPAILAVYLVLSYVFLGSSPVWDYATVTGRNLVRPLAWMPLRLGRADLTPFVMAVLMLVLLDALPNYLLTRNPDWIRRIWPH